MSGWSMIDLMWINDWMIKINTWLINTVLERKENRINYSLIVLINKRICECFYEWINNWMFELILVTMKKYLKTDLTNKWLIIAIDYC